MKKRRRWSDGQMREDATMTRELELERTQANALGIEISNLKIQNEWLAAQAEKPWNINNYRQPGGSTRRAVGAAA